MFASRETASCNVLAIPAVARALREVALAGVSECIVCAADGWKPSAIEQAEIARLAPGLKVEASRGLPRGVALAIRGEEIVPADVVRSSLSGEVDENPAILHRPCTEDQVRVALPLQEAQALLRAKSRAVLRGTAKPSDGIVSRTVNRPISQAITRQLLTRLGPIEPSRATIGTALLTLAMAACLVFMVGQAGLLLGALLFQAASIFDGVDGEIARATFKTSPRGASLDSLVDAATNLSFFAGTMINLYRQGEALIAGIGVAGLIGLALGTALLGMRAVANRGEVNFNSLKERLAGRRSTLMKWLTRLTMRDFYALAAAALIALGLAVPGVIVFAVIVAGWLLVVIATVFRRT